MTKITIDREIFRDKVLGCWLGKNAGGTLGEPLEGKFGKREMFHVKWYTCLPEGGIPNDDLELQLIWLQKLKEKGPGITAEDLTEAWMDCVAYNFDEYGLCKENMQKGLLPPVCGWHNNAFKDCMGSPIRSELWACIAPGSPETAAWYAYQDSIVDHGGGESVYGEIFNAVLESCAFVNDDKFQLLDAALSTIPQDSCTYQCVAASIENYRRQMSYEDNRNDLVNRFYHPVAQYSPLNLGFQTIGWLYGEDFGDALCKAVNCGWDTDCTAATLGAILGIIGGASSLPRKWTEPLGYEIATNLETGGIRNLTAPTDIRELTEAVCSEAERTMRYWGTSVRFTSDGTMSRNIDISVPELRFLKEYSPDSITYHYGGLRETIRYEKDAAILGDRKSILHITLENLHPEAREAAVALELPEGFSASAGTGAEAVQTEGTRDEMTKRERGQMLRLEAGEAKEFSVEIRAAGHKIRETNRCLLKIDVQNAPAVPAVPVVLTGGSRWLVSRLFPGRKIEEDCGIEEDKWFVSAPVGFTEQWNPGNDLRLGKYFKETGIVYALHYIYSHEEKDVVLGVPNNGYMKLFLNGNLIHTTKEKMPLRANLGNGGALGDLSNYKVTRLQKGWNQVLIKLQAEELPYQAHFTLGGMSSICAKNHGMPVLGICRSRFIWDEE